MREDGSSVVIAEVVDIVVDRFYRVEGSSVLINSGLRLSIVSLLLSFVPLPLPAVPTLSFFAMTFF